MSIPSIVVISTCIIWFILDVVLYVKRSKDKKTKTISMIIREATEYSLAISFAAGLLCGHWFWPL